MSIEMAKARLQIILDELDQDLQMLYSQGVLNGTDVKKIRNQAEVSNNALSRTLNEPLFGSSTRDKVLMALVADFEHSVQGYLEDAVARKGVKELLIYKLNKVDSEIQSLLRNMSADSNFEKAMSLAMTATRTYIFASLPKSKGAFGSKKDADLIAKNYKISMKEILKKYQTEQSIRILR